MSAESLTSAVVHALEALQVPYMLVGSFSSNYYGIPRSTQDADFVVQLGAVPVTAVSEKLGPSFRLDAQTSFETITATSRYVLQHADSAFKVELFMLRDDPHDQERFARRRSLPMFGRFAFIPSAEDVVTKLRWSLQGKRAKDIEDVRSVLAVQGDALDWDYIGRWCDRHGTRALLEQIRNSLPPV